MRANGLIGLPGIDPETGMDLDRLVEVRIRDFLDQRNCFVWRVLAVWIDLLDRFLVLLAVLRHVYTPCGANGAHAPPTRGRGLADDVDTHTAGGAFDLLDRAGEIDRVEILHLDLGDLPNLVGCHRPDLVPGVR